MLTIAEQSSPHYSSVFSRRGLSGTHLKNLEDLTLFPVTTKEEVRRAGGEMLTSRRPRLGWLPGHTSGTTGTPLSLWYDRTTCVLNNLADLRQKSWGGMGPGDWIGLLLGRMIVSTDRRSPPFWQANRPLRQVWFSAFHLQEEYIGSYVREIRRRGLRFLEGYPSTLFILARWLRERGETLPMTAVFSSSETLLELQREEIESAFECKLFDFYGHAERVIFATECTAHEGKHLMETYGYTELVGEDGQPVGDGEWGYLTGTSLHNTAMPLIRYRTGDMSRFLPGPCPCGRTERRIASVATKAEDIVVTPDGRMISPSVLTHPFKPLRSITASQIIQEDPGLIRVLVVSEQPLEAETRETLRGALADRLGPLVTIEIEQVPRLERERSGKFRWVISKVEHDCSLRWDG
jgi:phenylacetate-CoA ligase